MVTDPTTGNPTTGPLLDWWYVHAGYMGFNDGTSKSWDVPMGIEIEAAHAATVAMHIGPGVRDADEAGS